MRRIDHKIAWLEIQVTPPTWLNDDDIPADLLPELSTENNTMSVYEIEDDKSNLQDVIASLAANRDDVHRLDYVLIKKNLLTGKGLQFQKTDGDTPHKEVNEKYHWNVIELSGNKISVLGNKILNSEIESFDRKKIKTIIAEYIKNGTFSENDLKQSLIENL